MVTFLPAIIISSNIYSAQAAETTPNSWTPLSPMPTARGEFGTAVVNGKIYVIGGVNENNQPLNIIEEYNPISDQWTSKMTMPTPRSGLATVVYDNKIYVIGGSVGNVFVGNNEVYDPISNSWTTKASMPTPRADLTANLVNGQIYLIAGKKYSNQAPYYIETEINECYNPTTDSWSTKKPIATSVQGYASAVIDNKIYIIGGAKQSTSLGTVLVNNNQIYDTQTDQWNLGNSFPITCSHGAAITTEGTLSTQAIYYIGGYTGSQYSSQNRIYTVANNSWSTAKDMPTARSDLGLAVINDIIYAIGGFDGNKYLSTNEVYEPLGYGTVPPKIQIVTPENKTYQQVTLQYTINRGTSWIGYSLDGNTNVTITNEVKLSSLSQGTHQVRIYANDSTGNMGASNIVFFTIDSQAPKITLINPTNKSYDSTDIQLTFTLDDTNATLAYSLDGQTTIQIIGNYTLVALSNGGHNIAVFAIDSVGNASEESVYFDVAPFPWLLLVALLTIIIIVVAVAYIFFKNKTTKPEKIAAEVLAI